MDMTSFTSVPFLKENTPVANSAFACFPKNMSYDPLPGPEKRFPTPYCMFISPPGRFITLLSPGWFRLPTSPERRPEASMFEDVNIRAVVSKRFCTESTSILSAEA